MCILPSTLIDMPNTFIRCGSCVLALNWRPSCSSIFAILFYPTFIPLIISIDVFLGHFMPFFYSHRSLQTLQLSFLLLLLFLYSQPFSPLKFIIIMFILKTVLFATTTTPCERELIRNSVYQPIVLVSPISTNRICQKHCIFSHIIHRVLVEGKAKDKRVMPRNGKNVCVNSALSMFTYPPEYR